MARVDIEDLQEGMELGQDVKDANGRLLIPHGKVLGAREIRVLKMWGAVDVEIAGDEDEDEMTMISLDPAILEQVEPEVQDLFRHTDVEHPLVAELYQQCLTRLGRRIAAGGDHDA